MSDDIWELLSDSLHSRPQQPAWIRRLPAGGREVRSYRQIREAALALAARLHAGGVAAGDIVGIMAPNGPEWGIGALAVWRLGAILAPVHIGNSAQEIDAQVRALDPRLVLVHEAKHPLDKALAIAPPTPGEPAAVDALPARSGFRDEEAVRIYTSGSTGTPKIVRLSHRNVSSNVKAASKIAEIGVDDRFLSLLPLSHAMEMTGGMLTPLYCGASIVVPKLLAATEILAAMAEERISVVIAVPRLYRNIMHGLQKRFREAGPAMRLYVALLRRCPIALRRIVNRPLRRHFGGDLKCWLSGGSRLDPEIARFFCDLGMPLRQGYGLTETAPVVSVQDDFPKVLDSVGKPLDGVQVRIAQPQASGSGELLVRGPNVMLGYVDEAQTREVMREGWFNTGDLARIDAEGNVILTGRAKRLIVTEAGKNVYPEELETLLERFQEVKEAGVIEIDMRPAAVLAMGGADPVDAARGVLRRFNAAASGHNRISRFAVVDELPRTPLGKIALKALPEVFAAREVRG